MLALKIWAIITAGLASTALFVLTMNCLPPQLKLPFSLICLSLGIYVAVYNAVRMMAGEDDSPVGR